MKYRAFISYSHADQIWGQWLHRSLERYRVPAHLAQVMGSNPRYPTRLSPIFRDREELASSPDLSAKINQALEASESLVVICSPSAARSRWVDEEVERFKKLGRSNRIFCVIVDGDPAVAGSEQDCFPPALRKSYDADGNEVDGEAEPVAADARPHADGKKLARFKLIAGMLDVGLDELLQRELYRRNRSLLITAVSAVAVCLVMATLAINAVIARNEATLRREQADSLITFMLGDLRKRLQPVGRLDVLDAVGDQAMAYFSSLGEDGLTGNSALTRATAMRQIGEVRIAQGLIEEGLLAFNEAAELLNAGGIDDEATRLFELGQINYWIADAYFNDLKLDQASAYIQEYLALSRELVKIAPDKPEYKLELLYAESNLGTLAYRANDLDAARSYFRNALAMGRDLSTGWPDFSSDLDLAVTISWLGAIESSAGNLTLARQYYEEELDIHRSRWQQKDEPKRKYRLARALWLFADTLEQAGDLHGSNTALNESVRLYRELTQYDPLNYDWQEELTWVLTLLARDGYAGGRLSAGEARAVLQLARESLANIQEQKSVEVHRVSAAIEVEGATIELHEGAPEAAADLARSAVSVVQPLAQGDDRVRLLPLYAKAAYVSAAAESAMGDEAASRKIAQAALDNLAVNDNDPIRIRAYAALLADIAGAPGADLLLSTMAATEYRGTAFARDAQTANR